MRESPALRARDNGRNRWQHVCARRSRVAKELCAAPFRKGSAKIRRRYSRPSCWPEAYSLFIMTLEPLDVIFESVRCNHSQGNEVNTGLNWILGEQCMQLWVGLTAKDGSLTRVAINLGLELLSNGLWYEQELTDI